jgi:hypothetical protein
VCSVLDLRSGRFDALDGLFAISRPVCDVSLMRKSA